MSNLAEAGENDNVPYPMDPEPADSTETEAPLALMEDDDAEDQPATVGPAISEDEPIELGPVAADVDPPSDEGGPDDFDMQEPQADRQPQTPAGMQPGAFPISQAPSQRSPLENMSGMLGTDMQTPDFRSQIRDIMDPAFRDMSFEFQRQLNEAVADVTNGMEHRHLV